MWRWLRIKRILAIFGMIDFGLYVVGFLFFAFWFSIVQIVIGLFSA